MRNRKTFLPMLTLLGLAILAPTAPLAAQEQQPGVAPEAEGQQEISQPTAPSTSPESGLTLTGEIIAMDQQALRVRTGTGVENVILTNRTDKAADLAVGDQVQVDFTRSSQGVLIATRVREVAGAGTGAAGQPMSGSEVMGHAGHQDTSAPAQGQALDQTGQSGTTGATSGAPSASDTGSTGATTDTLGSAGSSGSTGSTADTTGATGSASGSSTGSTGTGYGTTTGSAGSTSSYDEQSVAAGTESDTATAGTLPDTGSGLPLAGLAGLLALGLALTLRSLR